MISKERLQEIRAAVEKASDGRWYALLNYPDGHSEVRWEYDDVPYDPNKDTCWRDAVVAIVPMHDRTTREEVDANAEFIALARTAVPDLLAELDRLRAEAAEMWIDQHLRRGGCDVCESSDGPTSECSANPYR